MKKLIALALIVLVLSLSLAACGGSNVDVSNKIFIDTCYFETQEVAEALLTAKGIPYTVTNAGTTSSDNLAEVIAEYIIVDNGQSGYYVNKGETVVLKVYTYEPEPEPEPEEDLGNIQSDESAENSPSSKPTTAAPSDGTGIVIEYDTNILMNVYDIRISVDGSVLGTQAQGEKKLYELTLAEGFHDLEFSQVGDDTNTTTESVTVSEGEYYYFFIKARNSGIEIESKDTMTFDEAQAFIGVAENSAESEEPTSAPESTPTPPQSQVTDQPEVSSDGSTELAEEIDLDAINETNSVDFDEQFVGKTYRIKGTVGEAIPPDDGLDAMIIIHPNVMAKGMGNTVDLEINIWMAADIFNVIGGELSTGYEVEVTAVLSSISRNATSNDVAIKGFPIQLEFDATKAVLLSDAPTESTPAENTSEKYPSGISIWNGDHTELKELILANMNDEGSYDHIETKWIHIDGSAIQQKINELLAGIGWSDKVSTGDFVIITEFSGKNAFNATVKSTAYGIEYENGNVKLLGIL